LKVTGSTISPSSFWWKWSFINSSDLNGLAVTGFVPCFFSHGRILVISKMVPSMVQTGWVKGCREMAQKLYGRRLKEPSGFADLVPEPALAEYVSSEAHSLWVIYSEILVIEGSGRDRVAYV